MSVLSRIGQVMTFVRTEQSRSVLEKTSATTAESHIEEGRTFWRTVVNRIGLGTGVLKIGGNGNQEGGFYSQIALLVRLGGLPVGRTENCKGRQMGILLQLVGEKVPLLKNLLGSWRKK